MDYAVLIFIPKIKDIDSQIDNFDIVYEGIL